jgi:uncharacterized protein
MTQRFVARNFDPMALARAGGELAGSESLTAFVRVLPDLAADAPLAGLDVSWTAVGRLQATAVGQDEAWLRLAVDATMPLTCQRCLRPVPMAVRLERNYRFVADEATAEAEDDASQEDVLALQRDMNLHELIEDELLMEMPLVPRHEVCPVDVKMAVADAGFNESNAPAPNAFAILARLQSSKSS